MTQQLIQMTWPLLHFPSTAAVLYEQQKVTLKQFAILRNINLNTFQCCITVTKIQDLIFYLTRRSPAQDNQGIQI